ncbi:MAG: aldo/keto reductase [Pseudomonadota bacterium]
MEYRKLGRTDLQVSALCLGTMTWGSQNTVEEGGAQIDMALDHGVNFLDSAEMYPTTPHRPETRGDTERVIGEWIASRKRRSDVIVATKIVGDGYKMIRDGAPISAETIRTAVDGSLQRLQTDYIDLYQLHWPNRGSYHFRQYWSYDPSGQDTTRALAEIEEILRALQSEIEAGRIRHVGLSNETAWGAMRFLQLAEASGLPRMASIQNEYSLLNRIFDTDLAEITAHEQLGLLAYSPLAAGLLTGKYRDGAVPSGSRAAITPGLFGRMTEAASDASEAYVSVADRHGLDPAQMAIACAMARPFMTSVIFGATTPEQLKTALGSADLRLDETVEQDILDVFKRFPRPY